MIQADPFKTTAIAKMKAPESVPQLRHFMGMVNQLGRFSPNHVELTQPQGRYLARKLYGYGDVNKNRPSLGSKNPQHSCYTIKQKQRFPLTLHPMDLELYYSKRVKNKEHWKPVAFASRSRQRRSTHNAQIERSTGKHLGQ